MKSNLLYLFTILLLTACVQDTHKCRIKDLYDCGPDNLSSVLIKSIQCHNTIKNKELYLQFNDSLKTKSFPFVFRQVTCINEEEEKAGISFYETVPSYANIDYKQFLILVNYDDPDPGVHIDATKLADSIKRILETNDKSYAELYAKIKQNPETDSLIRPAILITLSVKTDQNRQLSKEDYSKLIDYMLAISKVSISRVEELSVRFWGKSFTDLTLRQKIVVCRSIGYVITIEIT
ncbi:MAG: hypothetical protein GXO86_04700 [Chlorobi bacterium]|nr:hypothetical protein [Chlorobiota bacterium]